MTAPIQTLVHGMPEVLNGNLDLRLQVTRVDEMVEGPAEKKRIGILLAVLCRVRLRRRFLRAKAPSEERNARSAFFFKISAVLLL